MDIYRRWRHSRGFGVHSPFAYDLIREALYPKKGYLYYAELSPSIEARRGDAIPLPARKLLRLALFLRNHHLKADAAAAPAVAAIGPLPDCYRFALTAAGYRLIRHADRADLLILTDPNAPTPRLCKRQTLLRFHPATTINPNGENGENGEDSDNGENGLIILSRRYTLRILRPEMTHTTYSIL